MASYKIEDLTFTYPKSDKPALANIDLEIREGEFLLLIGGSGCGKSTLLRHLKTVLTPHGERSGRVLFEGRPLDTVPIGEQASAIGFVQQHPDDQIVTDKVWHELAFGLESLGTEQRVMRLRVAEMASYFGMEGLFYRDVCQLSGGQKQLLNLASVMAMNPRVIVLDEPTSQLDPIAAAEFLNTVKKLNTELGVTVILSEHRLEEAMPLCDRAAVMQDGRLIACSAPAETAELLYKKTSPMFAAMPAAARIACELGGSLRPALTVNEGRALLNGMGLIKKQLPATVCLRPADEPAIEAHGLFFRYEREGEDVLKGLDISLYKGEIMALVGGNGAGKSTLLSVLSGARLPYRGKLRVSGTAMKKRFNAFDAEIAVLYQDPRTLFAADTVEEDLTSAAVSRRKDGAEERLRETVAFMEIEELLSRHPFDLSGGEQQRAAIAKVLLCEPKILMLDEPTKGMDAAFKRSFGQMLKSLAESGLAILLVSHDVEFCAEYANRVGFIFDGAVVAENTPREFFCENTFYTTAANRIARDVFRNALLTEEVVSLAKQ